MHEISATKEIRRQGNSLVLILTKELSMIGLMNGDKVEVTLKRLDGED